MYTKTKAAFKWIAPTVIVMGMMFQPAMAGGGYHYKKHYYSYNHQHDPYCEHSNRQSFNNRNFHNRLRRNYYKQHHYNYNHDKGYGHGYGPKVRHYYRHGHRDRNGYQFGYRYRKRSGGYINIRF